MGNPDCIRMIVTKYDRQVDGMIEEYCDSDYHRRLCHFRHVAKNLLQQMNLSYSIKEGRISWIEGRNRFLEVADSLRYYLKLIKTNEKFRSLEMRTEKGYFEKIVSGADYGVMGYVEELKKQEGLK